MSLLRIAEVFGQTLSQDTAAGETCRASPQCPFLQGPCTKGGTRDPLGVCSLTDGERLAVVCPHRFLQGQRVFRDAARLAFAVHCRFIVVPELRILRVPGSPARRIGKIDYLLGIVDREGHVSDFAAVEVQAVYFSGRSIRPAFTQYVTTGVLPSGAQRRPDWRSSAQKRLMPQLALKVPVFRRWGKKFFVAVDSLFFRALPRMKTVNDVANSEVTWLVYPFPYDRRQSRFRMDDPEAVYTTWDCVTEALREGEPPSPQEILQEMELCRLRGRAKELTTRDDSR